MFEYHYLSFLLPKSFIFVALNLNSLVIE